MHRIEDLQTWYARQCDGDWEHTFGVRIETLDNPGWSVTIDLAGTPLEASPFQSIEDLGGEIHWKKIWVEDRQFKGVGSPDTLGLIIDIFLEWARGRDGVDDASG